MLKRWAILDSRRIAVGASVNHTDVWCALAAAKYLYSHHRGNCHLRFYFTAIESVATIFHVVLDLIMNDSDFVCMCIVSESCAINKTTQSQHSKTRRIHLFVNYQECRILVTTCFFASDLLLSVLSTYHWLGATLHSHFVEQFLFDYENLIFWIALRRRSGDEIRAKKKM